MDIAESLKCTLWVFVCLLLFEWCVYKWNYKTHTEGYFQIDLTQQSTLKACLHRFCVGFSFAIINTSVPYMQLAIRKCHSELRI